MPTLNIAYNLKVPVLSWLPRVPYPTSYRLYWATSPEGVWTLCRGADHLSILQYQDTEHPYTSEPRIWYKVMAVVGGLELEHCPATISSERPREDFVNRMIDEVVRRHTLILNRFSGEYCTLYLRKAAGDICPNHAVVGDGSRNEFGGSLCPVCYNVGIVGGYEKVTNVLVKIKNNVDNTILGQEGMTILTTAGAWLGSYPMLISGDFFERPSGERFAVDTVRRRQIQNRNTMQILAIAPVEPNHPFYQIS